MSEPSRGRYALSINYESTIKHKKLVYQSSSKLISEYFWMYFSALMLMALASMPLWPFLFDNSGINPWMCTISVVFEIWMLANLITLNLLIKVKGVQKRQTIAESLVRYFPNLKFYEIGKNILRDVEVNSGGNFVLEIGKIVTIVLNDTETYINITSLTKGASVSPFHGLSNYLKCRRIAKDFEK